MKFTTIAAAFLAPIVAMATSIAEDSVVAEGAINIAAAKAGQLYVRLNSASGLRDKDLVGKSDPYFELWLEKAYKSRSKDNKGLNPVYDETFCFYVRPGQNKLYIRAVDKDTFRDDKIGDTSISLDQVMASNSVGPQDYPLPKWFGLRSDGKVNLQMQFVPDTTAA
ncbi:MAG: C2 domain-containing protein [Linnemannia gamsii]|nr:MAG: C2 domain-containing protein [Linnemannia gamsii]